ncbi:MAG TPA: hypothetical protein VF765_07565 [Polyangiaceae bacterium]
MQASYRASPELPKPIVVVYRPVPAWLAALLSLTMLFMIGFGAFGTLQMTRTVTLDLSRADDACTITRSNPVGDDVEKHPLSSVEGTRLVTIRGKHGTLSYEVELTTATATISLSSMSGSLALRQAQKRQIDAFLAGKDPSLHLVYDVGGGLGYLMLLVCVIPLIVLRTMWLSARVTVDAASRVLTIARSRWPLGTASESIPMGEIENVDVSQERNRKGGRVYRVVVILRSGQRVPLLKMSSNVLGPHRRAADQLRAALQQAAAPPAFPA